jgi:2-polyprenyl-3-methyl-5-hydroxy-6-metoxy-1,4-benzoquinol methylase
MQDDLLRLLDHPAVDPMAITPAILTALRPVFDSADPATLSENALLLRAMTLNPFKDRQIEKAITQLRRKTLDTALSTPDDQSGLPFAGALAQHCFLNEYIFQTTAEERGNVARLEAGISAALDQGSAVPHTQIAAFAAYQPLLNFAWADRLQSGVWPEPVQSILTQQISEPLEERRTRDRISQLTPIQDCVSQEVRAQYEENPYPRWIKFASSHRPEPIGDILRGAPLRFSIDDYRSPESPEVLIAGCGTGQQSLLAASRYAKANILAVDLSRASLAYAQRKTNEHGIETIDYAQADILALCNLKRDFDLIESVGVLHHLDDPLAGWRVLTDLLRPGGLMKVGLYSEAARVDVVAARALVAEHGYEATADGFRRCRETIATCAEGGDPLMTSITERSSFYTASEFRDLIFHVQERRFTLPRIDTALRSLGVTFLGFELADPGTLRAFKATHGNAVTDLSRWHDFETANPDTFRAMYQFWVQKR